MRQVNSSTNVAVGPGEVLDGMDLVRVASDGACLFRSIAVHVFGDEGLHDVVRSSVMDHIESSRDHFEQFMDGEDFVSYVRRKRQAREYGNHLEVQAAAEVFCRPVQIYTLGESGLQELNVFHGNFKDVAPPILLLYSNGNHYDALLDPQRPSVGVGLGLAPGRPAAAPLQAALADSEAQALEEAMLESIRFASDQQLTEKEMERAILEESRRDYLRREGWAEEQPWFLPGKSGPYGAGRGDQGGSGGRGDQGGSGGRGDQGGSGGRGDQGGSGGRGDQGATVGAGGRGDHGSPVLGGGMSMSGGAGWSRRGAASGSRSMGGAVDRAGAGSAADSETVDALVAMGFSPDEALMATSVCGNDLATCIDYLT